MSEEIELDCFEFKSTFNIKGHIVRVSFISRGSWSTWGKPQTFSKFLTYFLTCICSVEGMQVVRYSDYINH